MIRFKLGCQILILLLSRSNAYTFTFKISSYLLYEPSDFLYKLNFYFHRETQQDIFNAMGSLYSAILFIGITNGTAVQPVLSVERFVSYRERAAGMYSALPFAFAQVYF